jgi:mono/diheme cytochrome c family protein
MKKSAVFILMLMMAGGAIRLYAQVPPSKPSTPASAAGDAHPALPPGAGRDIVVRTCSQCHAVEIVTQQHMGLDGWKKLVDLMATNGANATDAEFDQITNYLAASFPELPADAGTSK